MFSQGGGVGGADTSITFNAGKCLFDGMTVTPQKEKGMVSIVKSQHGVNNLVWTSRETNRADDPIMLFAGDVDFRQSKSAPPASRVFYLNFQGNRREFFWMQTKDAAGDDAALQAVNAAIKGEAVEALPSGGAGTASPGAGGDPAFANHLGIDEEQIAVLSALAPDEREQMVTMLGLADHPAFRNLGSGSAATPAPGSGPAAAAGETPAAAATPAEAPPVRPAAAAAAAAATAETPGAGAAAFSADMLASVMSGAIAEERPGADLSDILTPELLDPLLENEAFVAALLPHLPEGQQTTEGLKDNIKSPQFQQALKVLNEALQSGDLAGSMSQFGVDPAVVAANGGGVLGLAMAIAAADGGDGSEQALPMDTKP